MWHNLRDRIGLHWNATRHEDKLNLGVPDVSFGALGVNGWIELKAIKGWPKRQNSPVSIPHYSKEQRIWIYQRGQYSKCVWALLRVGREWLLFDPMSARLVLGIGTADEHRRAARKIWIDTPPVDEFLKTITQ